MARVKVRGRDRHLNAHVLGRGLSPEGSALQR